jgi:hypothetical protein
MTREELLAKMKEAKDRFEPREATELTMAAWLEAENERLRKTIIRLCNEKADLETACINAGNKVFTDAMAALPESSFKSAIYGPDPYTTRGAMADTSSEAAIRRLGMDPSDPQN